MKHNPKPQPCSTATKGGRIRIYNPTKDRMVSVEPYSATAKKLYKYYIQEEGYDPSWIAPPDLKYYEESGVFRRVKAPEEPKVASRLSYKNYLSCHTIHNLNKVKGYKGFELLHKFKPQLTSALKEHGGLKVYPAARCHMDKTLEGKTIAEIDDFYITSGIVAVTDFSQIDQALKDMISGMMEKVPEKETQGSGWSFQRVSTLEVHLAKYKPLKGSSYIELPDALKAKGAVINVKNTDEQCFKWAVLSALYPAKSHGERTSQYKPYEDRLDWSGLTFPVSLDKIALFERRNKVCINVYGCDVTKTLGDWTSGQEWLLSKIGTREEKAAILNRRRAGAKYSCKPHLLYKSKFGAEAQASIEARAQYTDEEWDILGAEPLKPNIWRNVDLLLLNDDSKSHYCWIKSFSRFARQPSDHKHCAKHFCHYCLHGFQSKDKLNQHLNNGCREITDVKPVLPKPGQSEAFINFKNYEKQYKAPFVVYADFEALTKPVSKTDRDPSKSYTDAYQTHEPCGYCIYVVSSDPARSFEPIVYRGENTVKSFIFDMKELEEDLKAQIQEVTPMDLTAQEERSFQAADKCCLCNGRLGKDRVRDHDHLTGRYRGAAHNKCNLEEGKKRTKHFTIPVFFHNLKGYDSHLIMSEVGKHTSKLSAIPQNFEKMISFSFSHFRFLDSQAFLNTSLEKLVANLYDGGAGKHKFKHSIKHCPKPQHLDLLLKKGVYPYDYMDDWSRFDEEVLPPKHKFFSKLSDCDIGVDEYKHGKRVWKAFDCRTLGDYHDLYVQSDVLLLADVFESHRDLCLEYYDLDPAHYFTTPNFAWDAMLKKTGVKLELLTDYDQYLMVEQGLRGGIAMISHRHAEANNPQMGSGYDKDKEHSYIAYLDANNLYGWAMRQPLPQGDFKWEKESNVDKLIEDYADNPNKGCIVKCDLAYPAELHDEHNDYPLAPERKLVTQGMLSSYAKELQQKLEIGRDTAEKLVPNLQDKEGYVVDIRNLKFYVDHGLQVTKVHSVLSFTQSTWMKPYIDFNTDKRKQAKTDFEKDLFKLMNNSPFGKTMENVRSRVSMSFVTTNAAWNDKAVKLDRTVERKIASPLYDGHIIYNDDLVAIKQKQKQLVLNKPIYAGMCILDLSKLLMYRFHYDVIRKQYGHRAKLLFTDTDSLCYRIETSNFYQDMKDNKELYDLSGYDHKSPYYDATNKKVVGKFKDECDGKSPKEFVGLRPKMYSLLVGDEAKKTAKGVKTAYMKNKLSHSDYSRCLKSTKRSDQQQLASFNNIRSTKHVVQSIEIQKVGLCCYDNKRYLLDDGITSYAYGHYKISTIKSMP